MQLILRWVDTLRPPLLRADPPRVAARSMALPPWPNSAKSRPAAPAWRKKLCLWTRPKTAWTMDALEFIRKARRITPGGTFLAAGTTAKEPARSPLPTATQRFGDGTEARSLPIIRWLTLIYGTPPRLPTRRPVRAVQIICAMSRLARFTEIFKVSKCGKTKLLIGQHLSSRIYEENSDNLRRYHE